MDRHGMSKRAYVRQLLDWWRILRTGRYLRQLGMHPKLLEIYDATRSVGGGDTDVWKTVTVGSAVPRHGVQQNLRRMVDRCLPEVEAKITGSAGARQYFIGKLAGAGTGLADRT